MIRYLALLFFFSLIFQTGQASTEEPSPLPAWFLFYQMMDTENLSAVIWGSGESEETFKQHAIIAKIPEWVQESGGRKIESKTAPTTFNYYWLPYSFKSFIHFYGVDAAAIREASGKSIIDMGHFSDQFEPIDPELLKQIDAHIASWYREDDWIVHPRPEPTPPKWLNQPLNRKFYYELRD